MFQELVNRVMNRSMIAIEEGNPTDILDKLSSRSKRPTFDRELTK